MYFAASFTYCGLAWCKHHCSFLLLIIYLFLVKKKLKLQCRERHVWLLTPRWTYEPAGLLAWKTPSIDPDDDNIVKKHYDNGQQHSCLASDPTYARRMVLYMRLNYFSVFVPTILARFRRTNSRLWIAFVLVHKGKQYTDSFFNHYGIDSPTDLYLDLVIFGFSFNKVGSHMYLFYEGMRGRQSDLSIIQAEHIFPVRLQNKI